MGYFCATWQCKFLSFCANELLDSKSEETIYSFCSTIPINLQILSLSLSHSLSYMLISNFFFSFFFLHFLCFSTKVVHLPIKHKHLIFLPLLPLSSVKVSQTLNFYSIFNHNTLLILLQKNDTLNYFFFKARHSFIQ